MRLLYVHSASANVSYVESPLSPGQQPKTECMCGVLGEAPVTVAVTLSIGWEGKPADAGRTQRQLQDRGIRGVRAAGGVEALPRPRDALLGGEAEGWVWGDLWRSETWRDAWCKAREARWLIRLAERLRSYDLTPPSLWDVWTSLCTTLSAFATLVVLFM
tara:strand:- start:1999 stop:2478 length:480 start_codon:yes stop_codon:yes gene_type:complete